MTRKRALIAVVVLAGAGAAGGLMLRRSPGSRADAAGPITARATRREVTSAVTATGAVKPQVGAEVRVGARISGKVKRLHANIKDVVKKGQIIAELETDDLDAAVAQRRAEVVLAESRLAAVGSLLPMEIDKARSEVARWQATVTLARKERGRQEDLIKQEFATEQMRDQSHERLTVAETQLAAARKSFELAETRQIEESKQGRAERDRARAALGYASAQHSFSIITAPISGVVASVSTQEGETVAAGLNAPTFVTIIDLGRLQVDAYVDEVDIGKILVGQKAVCTVDAFPALEFEGQVVAIYPKAVVIDNVVKYVVAIEISTPYEGKLRPDMTTNVSIKLGTRTALAIPAKAAKREQGRNVVYILDNGRVEVRDVKLGWKDGALVEVVSGLKEGDEVLLAPPAAEKGAQDG